MTLRPYMVHTGRPEEGAALAFAHTAREAKKISWPAISGWEPDADYIDLRTRALPPRPWIMELAAVDQPHCIDDPPTCPTCEYWGGEPLGDRCSFCIGEQEP